MRRQRCGRGERGRGEEAGRGQEGPDDGGVLRHRGAFLCSSGRAVGSSLWAAALPGPFRAEARRLPAAYRRAPPFPPPRPPSYARLVAGATFRVPGGGAVRSGDAEQPVRGRRERAVLATLLAARGAVV